MLPKIVKKITNHIVATYNNIQLRLQGIHITIKPGCWAIGLDDALVIAKEIKRYEQKRHVRVLEIGSGYSTLLISSVLENRADSSYEFYSIEADENWIKKVTGWVGKCEKKRVNIININYEGDDNTFNIDKIITQTGGNFDIVLVDAPPDTNGENVRLKTCEALLPFMTRKGTMLLHDTNRTDERFAYLILRAKFLHSRLCDTAKGIAIFYYPQ